MKWFFLIIGLVFCLEGESSSVFHRDDPYLDQDLIRDFFGNGDYLKWNRYIDPQKVHQIVEVGSRDAIDSILLGYYYQCPVIAFECNPEGLERCYKNVEKYPYVTVVPMACYSETKDLLFYPVKESNGGSIPTNIGGSSLFKVREGGPEKSHKQGPPISVHATRLDTYMEENGIQEIDLLCMDVQGATLEVLKGLGEKLHHVKYIITEVYFTPAWYGETLFPEIAKFLEGYGFALVPTAMNGPFCDVMFIRK